MRCQHCGASLAMPDELTLQVACPFCGLTADVPNRAARAAELRQREDVARDVARQQHEAQQAASRARKAAAEARRERRGAVVGRIWYGLLALIGPAIAAWFLFDIPARFLGNTGSDRAEAWSVSRRAAGCTSLVAPEVVYLAGDAVVAPLPSAAGCVEVFAAGGTGHGDLELTIVTTSGNELARAPAGRDVLATTCEASAEPRRIEIHPGPAAKGRLTYAAFACPSGSTHR